MTPRNENSLRLKGVNLNFKVYDDIPFTEEKAFYDVTNVI